jgi:predicted O-methyltransferase YrrM
VDVLALTRHCIALGAVQKASELAPLLSLLCRYELKAVLEVGTLRGGTLAAWCALAAADAVIVSVDLPGGSFGGGYTEQEASGLRAFAGDGQQLHLLRADSHEPATRDRVVEALGGRPVDFLHIDGDHTYDGVRADYEMYVPLLAPGGVVALHDILFHPAVPEVEVHRLWAEAGGDWRRIELVDAGDDRGWGQWGGFGVLLAPDDPVSERLV